VLALLVITPATHGDFFWVWCSRALYYMDISSQAFLLYYIRYCVPPLSQLLADATHAAATAAHESSAQAVALEVAAVAVGGQSVPDLHLHLPFTSVLIPLPPGVRWTPRRWRRTRCAPSPAWRTTTPPRSHWWGWPRAAWSACPWGCVRTGAAWGASASCTAHAC